MFSGKYYLPVSEIKAQGNKRSDGGRSVVNHGVLEFGMMADGSAGENFPNLSQNQRKQHYAEVFDRPEPQRQNTVDFGYRLDGVFVGRLHKEIENKAQNKSEVQQQDKTVF